VQTTDPGAAYHKRSQYPGKQEAIDPRASRLFQLVVGCKAGWTACAEVEIKHSLPRAYLSF
jgi:hypothetical protein